MPRWVRRTKAMAPDDPKKRGSDDKTKVRIDNSDVYLENDKLTEALESNLDHLSRRRHRQLITRDHEIRELRQKLTFASVTKTVSALASLRRPRTASPAPRILKPPPNIVKLNVRVPKSCAGSKDSDASNDDESDDVTNSSGRPASFTEDKAQRNGFHYRAMKPARVAWGEPASQQSEPRKKPKHDIKKVTKEQILLSRLDMEAIPTSWYTKVHHPSDVPLHRRASSARPFSRNTATRSTVSSARRKADEGFGEVGSKISGVRRVKSAIPSTTTTTATIDNNFTASPFHTGGNSHDEDCDWKEGTSILCGGQQQQNKQADVMRSRRQLMELTGARKQAGFTEADSSRLKFLEAVRLERERLDVRVKLFLQSCDRVGEGGVSSRKVRDYRSIVLPQVV